MDVLEVLHEDHQRVKQLFLQAQSAGESDQSRLFQQIRQELRFTQEWRKASSILRWKR
jgi:hypothetical protein